MSRAGISGMGVISALGDGLETTRKALFAAEPLPNLPRRFETALKLPVFEIPEPVPVGDAGLPVRFLLRPLSLQQAPAPLRGLPAPPLRRRSRSRVLYLSSSP